MSDPIFDPTQGGKWILDGRIVPMTGQADVIADGRVYIDGGLIAAVQPADAPRPNGFAGAPVVNSGGTIFPGMIELHNHLAYNVLPLWNVPRPYEERGQWGRHKDYRKLISGPMNVLGRTEGLIQAVVRWVEAKTLISGTTTSQGIALFSNAGIRKYYRGLIRNVEETNDPALPEAATKIGDVEAADAAKFRKRLKDLDDGDKKLILHLAEGRNDNERANNHFRALKVNATTWAINPALVGIHCTGLKNRNFETFGTRGGSIVWSPLSNLLLYGVTTDIARAREEGIPISLGSDWSPSGSKNLLMELKAARLYCDAAGVAVSDFELAKMVTTNPASMIGWGAHVGTVEPGRRADLFVVHGKQGDPYERLVRATETSIVLVVINGVRRYGQASKMRGLATEPRTIAGSRRAFNFDQDNIEPSMASLSLADAEAKLTQALDELPEFARRLELGGRMSLTAASGKSTTVQVGRGASMTMGEAEPGAWFLELDHIDEPPFSARPKLANTGTFDPSVGASVPLAELLESIRLDGLDALSDSTFWRTFGIERNLLDGVREQLPAYYGRPQPPPLPPLDAAAALDDGVGADDAVDGPLSRDEQLILVRQAILILDQAYVHLPFKRSLHAVDPVQRLRLLDYRLSTAADGALDELEFHTEMSSIFASVRDLHTNYLLPEPYRSHVALLPFRIEEYFEQVDGREVPHYLVSRLQDPGLHPTFVEGVHILRWNGVPIRTAIMRNAERQSGSNPAAAFARGLEAMTVRPLMTSVPPDEEWISIAYVGLDGVERTTRMQWRYLRTPPSPASVLDDARAATLGIDLQAAETGKVRKHLFAPAVAQAEAATADGQWVADLDALGDRLDLGRDSRGLLSHLPGVLRASTVADGRVGWLRIFTFDVHDVDAFVDEVERLVGLMPAGGLILDVRGNGGGAITAAERILQLFTPSAIRPTRAQFTTSPLLLEVAKGHSPSTLLQGFDLSDWIPSLEEAVATGSEYSRGYPITDPGEANDRGQRYYGPVVLIVDAMSYSATDIFAAGFVDHGIGSIIGTADNMGAGGANVWRHTDLATLGRHIEDNPFVALPREAEVRFAVRRITRVGSAEGEVLEDLGIRIAEPDRHHMRAVDLTDGNRALVDFAVRRLADAPRREFGVRASRLRGNRLSLTVESSGVDELEVRIDGRVRATFGANAGRQVISGLGPSGRSVVEVNGLSGPDVVARHRVTL